MWLLTLKLPEALLLTLAIQALTNDLGLTEASDSFIKTLIQGPVNNDPLGETDDLSNPEDIALSTGGSINLLAYWVFSSTVFDANHPTPAMHIFPEHFALLEQFLQDDAHEQIRSAPGTIASLVALGLWLEESKLISAGPAVDETKPSTAVAENPSGNFMTYHHLLTLVAVYHPSVQVRNAASSLAGAILHDDPVLEDRLRILEDLLENCMFTNLKACAVTWLREELLAALSPSSSGGAASGASTSNNIFATPDALDTVQYAVFPSLGESLREADQGALAEYWVVNAPFLIQAANFALFLWRGDGRLDHLVPEGMDAAVGERWAEPLLAAAERYLRDAKGEDGKAEMEVSILKERLERLRGTEGFGGLERKASPEV